MSPISTLYLGDWLVIAWYMVAVLGIGWAVKKQAGLDRINYFLAGRSLPWWWVGTSMAATTFAADTPLAVTGLVAAKGLSGNWLWLPVIGIHAAVVTIFAEGWSRSGVITDAEFIHMRYSGSTAVALRWCRVGLQLLTNCIVLGWVIRAMVKIVSPFFTWEAWIPDMMNWLTSFWPHDIAPVPPAEGLTILALLAIVACYSSLGGLRGVVITDLIQLGLALLGSAYLATQAWYAVDGRKGLLQKLASHYGQDHFYLDVFPTPGAGWLGTVGIGAGMFGLYLIVQSYSQLAADGGGYFMQRLNAARSPQDAKKGALLFFFIHYIIRVWPWFIVSLAALVLIPIGHEGESLNGAAAFVASDREMAWPILMAHLLEPGWLGLVLASLLAAFMSTVDTHINWGASYVVTDIWLVLRPDAPDREQIRVARITVILFVLVAILISCQINTIEQAWKWIATLGASLGLPTILRWLWWRVNATGEITSMIGGIVAGILLTLLTDLPYEIRLLWIAATSAVGLLGGIILGPATDKSCLRRFVTRVQPLGCWPPDCQSRQGTKAFCKAMGYWVLVIAGTFSLLLAGHQFFFVGGWFLPICTATTALFCWWGVMTGMTTSQG